MSDRPLLRASSRTIVGKEVSRLRKEGKLPAVIFGHGESVPVTVDAHELDSLRRHVGPNSLIDLAVDGAAPQSVLIAHVDRNILTQRPIHVDFHVVRLTEELTVEVPVVARGVSPAVDKLGGTLVHPVSAVKVKARADHLPQEIDVDVSNLVDFDGAVHVRDLVVPPGATILDDPDELVLRVLPPRVEAVEEAPAEGEAAPAGAPAAAPAAPAAPEG